MKMRETWRWFGPQDPVTLQDIRQTGAQGTGLADILQRDRVLGPKPTPGFSHFHLLPALHA